MAGLAGESGRRRGSCLGPEPAAALLTYTGGRWKLWREEDGAIEVSHNDAGETYTASCWDRTVEAVTAQRFALGCASGRVQVWGARTGELLGPIAEAFRALARGGDCAVAALAIAHPDRGSVFVGCHAVPDILEVGIADGLTRSTLKAGKQGIVQLACAGGGLGGWLVSGGAATALKLWRLPKALAEVPATAQRLSAPGSAPTCLDVHCTGGRVLALSASGTSQLDVFVREDKAEAAEAKAAPMGAAFVLSCHERIVSASFVRAEAGGKVIVAAAGPAVAALWALRPEKATGTAKTMAPLIIISSLDLGGRSVLSCRGGSDAGGGLILALGPATQPTFADARRPAEKGGKPAVAHRAAGGKRKPALEAGAAPAQAAAAPAAPTVLGPLEASVARVKPRKRSAIGPAAEAAAEEAAAKRAKMMPEGGKAAAGLSIAPMVRQGLRSKDTASIEKALQNGNKRVIDSTVAELSGAEAFDLIQECTTRLLSQPIRGQVLCVWIQRVLLRHCAFIFSQPTLHRALQPLHDAFQSRCSSYRMLARLRGRLHTLRGHGRRAIEKRAKDRATTRQPLVEYTEGDEDAEEDALSEDPGAAEGGDLDESEFDEDDSDICMDFSD